MRSFRGLWIAAGIIGVLAVLGLSVGTLWLNSFIHSDAFRQEMEARAGQTLGGTVEIKQIDFSLWSGVTLTGLATKLQTNQGVLVTQVESVRCSYSLLGLLDRKLQLQGVTVIKPQVVLTQEPASTVPTPPLPSTPAEPVPAADAQSGQTAPFQLLLEKAKITDGHLSIRDATGAIKADLQGVQISARNLVSAPAQDVTGEMRIANVSLPQNLNLTDFSTPFTYRAGVVDARPFAATAFAGQVSGDYLLNASGPSLLEVNAIGVDMSQVGQAVNPGASTRLSGSLALQSKWHAVETGTLIGEGDAQITGGKLEGVSLLRDLALAFRVKGLNDPDLKSVTTHFEIANGSTRFTHLVIESNVFAMTGDGVIDPQGRLDANMLLILHGDAMGGIPGAAATFFSKLPDGGGSIPFHLSGTAAHPQADLNTRLFIQSSQVEKTINKALNHLFH